MKLDLTSLQLFIHIVETGTIAGGAARMNIVTSAASKRVVELEEMLGTPLLRRTNRGVEPTAAGAELENRARRVVIELDDISLHIRDFSKGIRGHVRVFVNSSAMCQGLPARLAEFLSTHPEVYVHVEERSNQAILKAVAENHADVGISFRVQHGYSLEDTAYQDYRLNVLVPRDHPLATRRDVRFIETLDHPHIGLRAESGANIYMSRQAADLGRSINYRMYAESFHVMALLIEAGLGIGIAPEGLLGPFARNFGVRALPLKDPWASRELRLYHAEGGRLQAASQLLVEHLRQSGSASAPA